MTLDDVYRLWRYWERNPPLRLLVAGLVGFKPPEVDNRISLEEWLALTERQ